MSSEHARIGGDDVDEVGDLTSGGTRDWNVFPAAQTSNGRIRVSADGIEPFEVDLD